MNLFFKYILYLGIIFEFHCHEYIESIKRNPNDKNNTSDEFVKRNISNSSEFRTKLKEQVYQNNSEDNSDLNNIYFKGIDELDNNLVSQPNKNLIKKALKKNLNDNHTIDDNIEYKETRILNNQTKLIDEEILKHVFNYENITNYDDFDFEDIQNIRSKEDEDNEFLEEDLKNKKEWVQEMTDFEAAEIITFEIQESEDEILYDIINIPNSIIRISLFVNDEKDRIDLRIYDPQGKLINKIEDKIHIFFKFNATITGEYVYVIDNKINDIPLKVTFAIDQGQSCDLKLSKEHINSTHYMIQNIKHLIKNAKFAARFLTKKYDAHYDHVQNHNKNFFFFAMIETFALILIFFFQICYIKSLVKNKQQF